LKVSHPITRQANNHSSMLISKIIKFEDRKMWKNELWNHLLSRKDTYENAYQTYSYIIELKSTYQPCPNGGNGISQFFPRNTALVNLNNQCQPSNVLEYFLCKKSKLIKLSVMCFQTPKNTINNFDMKMNIRDFKWKNITLIWWIRDKRLACVKTVLLIRYFRKFFTYPWCNFILYYLGPMTSLLKNRINKYIIISKFIEALDLWEFLTVYINPKTQPLLLHHSDHIATFISA